MEQTAAPGPPHVPGPDVPREPVPGPHDAPPAGDGPGEGPRALGIGIRPTGHPGVDAVLRRLTDADHLAVPGHPEVYEDVHRGLTDTLASLDQPSGPPAPGRSHDPRS
ncbi:hypothetical protein GCM10009716_02580 [Streptomyces sodiiphilus]|uniref:Uncharacterized protein n=1 Tax=Streptomyces sodiiphilus TaxID=226217 RepID=A0ABP5A2U2_9ACTN